MTGRRTEEEVIARFFEVRQVTPRYQEAWNRMSDEERHAVWAQLGDRSRRPTTRPQRRGLSAEIRKHAIIRFLVNYVSPGAAKKPVKIVGEPGLSKTFLAELFGKTEFDRFEMLQGHGGNSMRSVVAGAVPNEQGGFSKVYGTLARAFRSAREGLSTCLLIDEWNRMPPQIKSVFVTALNKHENSDGVLCFVLDTGVPGEELETEKIWAPAHQLSIIATANEGHGFHVSVDDNAEEDRFRPFRVSFDQAEFSKAIAPALKKKGFDGRLGAGLVRLAVRTREAVLEHSTLRRALSLRHVCEAIQFAERERDVVEDLMVIAKGILVSLDSRNQINEEQLAAFQSMLQRELGAWMK